MKMKETACPQTLAEDLDNHTIEFAAYACVGALCVHVSQHIRIRYAKPIKCIPQQNATALCAELSLYAPHKECTDS